MQPSGKRVNVKLLIDAVVRQTMVLIAQLATASGARASLAHVADKVFLELVTELERQGVRRKVVADMFGLALRSYQKRVRRLSESAADSDATLWQAMLTYLQEREVVARTEILQRFRYDDEAMVRGILGDLVDTGLVFKTGQGARVAYRAARDTELGFLEGAQRDESLQAMTWMAIYKHGPLTLEALDARLAMDRDELAAALDALCSDGRVVRQGRQDADPVYVSAHYIGSDKHPIGWEAAVADHVQAVVSTLGRSLHKAPDDPHASAIGGSTYSFDVWPGHPFEAQALGMLARIRADATALRKATSAHAADRELPGDAVRVTFYVGQTVAPSEPPPPSQEPR